VSSCRASERLEEQVIYSELATIHSQEILTKHWQLVV
jgi:hypothetical protein